MTKEVKTSKKPKRRDADALDEMVVEFSAQNPNFPKVLEAAERRRKLLRTLAEQRREQDLSQTQVAAAMRTSQPALARLEGEASDAKLSTVERYAAALGYQVEYRLVPARRRAKRKPVVVES